MNEKPAPRGRGTASRWPLLAGLCVVLVILGATIGRRLPVDADPREPEAAARTEVPAPAQPGFHAARARVPLSPEQRRERREAAQAEQVRKGRDFHAALAARYASEPVDAAWASAKEAKLLAASASDEIRRLNALPENYRASCRSTVCRIGADFPNRGAVQDWLTLFSTGVGSELPNEAYIVTNNPDGSVHLDIMGLARQ
ncbi:MAG: hypothetical protein QM719_00430 [Thermomonas sp.]